MRPAGGPAGGAAGGTRVLAEQLARVGDVLPGGPGQRRRPGAGHGGPAGARPAGEAEPAAGGLEGRRGDVEELRGAVEGDVAQAAELLQRQGRGGGAVGGGVPAGGIGGSAGREVGFREGARCAVDGGRFALGFVVVGWVREQEDVADLRTDGGDHGDAGDGAHAFAVKRCSQW